jgi:hypothetical protein
MPNTSIAAAPTDPTIESYQAYYLLDKIGSAETSTDMLPELGGRLIGTRNACSAVTTIRSSNQPLPNR